MRNLLCKAALLLLLAPLAGPQRAAAQGYVKLNALYALVGVVNPSVEFAVSPKSTLQTDIVVSPWKSIDSKHMLFAIFMGEYRRYFKEHNRGWYLGANLGMMAFDMSKPYIENWSLKFEDRYCKGYGMMIGLCVAGNANWANGGCSTPSWAGRGWTATTTVTASTARSTCTPTGRCSPSIPTRSTARASGCPIRSAYRSV